MISHLDWSWDITYKRHKVGILAASEIGGDLADQIFPKFIQD